MPPRDSRLSGFTRHTPMPLLVSAALLLVFRIGAGVAETLNSPRPRDLVEWQPIAGSLDAARTLGRPLLYDFSAEGCGPCRQVQRDLFARRIMADTIDSHFYPVRVVDRMREDGKNSAEAEELIQRFAVEGFPTLVVVSAEGGEPKIFTGYPGEVKTTMFLEKSREALATAPASP